MTIQQATALARDTKPFKALCDLTNALDQNGISHVVTGSMALSLYSYHRFANDIDLIVKKDSLRSIRKCLDVDRYLTLDASSNRLWDAFYEVNIDLLLAGDFPGDRNPKAIVFPEPNECYELREGFKCLPIDTLMELKLASGLCNPRRLIDLADAQELIVLNSLPRSFVALLHPDVQRKFLEMFDIIENNPA